MPEPELINGKRYEIKYKGEWIEGRWEAMNIGDGGVWMVKKKYLKNSQGEPLSRSPIEDNESLSIEADHIEEIGRQLD